MQAATSAHLCSQKESPLKDSKASLSTVLTMLFFRYKNNTQLECGPMPNMMATLPNIGGTGTLCSTPQSLADAHYQRAVQ